MLGYVIGWLDDVICLIVAVPSLQISEVSPRADVAYSFVDNLKIASAIVSNVTAFLGVHLQVCFLLRMISHFVVVPR